MGNFHILVSGSELTAVNSLGNFTKGFVDAEATPVLSSLFSLEGTLGTAKPVETIIPIQGVAACGEVPVVGSPSAIGAYGELQHQLTLSQSVGAGEIIPGSFYPLKLPCFETYEYSFVMHSFTGDFASFTLFVRFIDDSGDFIDENIEIFRPVLSSGSNREAAANVILDFESLRREDGTLIESTMHPVGVGLKMGVTTEQVKGRTSLQNLSFMNTLSTHQLYVRMDGMLPSSTLGVVTSYLQSIRGDNNPFAPNGMNAQYITPEQLIQLQYDMIASGAPLTFEPNRLPATAEASLLNSIKKALSFGRKVAGVAQHLPGPQQGFMQAIADL